jgi:hypothetical protein
LFTGFDGDGAALNDELRRIDGVGDLACGRVKGCEVRFAVLRLGNTDAKEYDIGAPEGASRVGGESERAGGAAAQN